MGEIWNHEHQITKVKPTYEHQKYLKRVKSSLKNHEFINQSFHHHREKPGHDGTEVHGTHGVLQARGHSCPVGCCLRIPRSWRWSWEVEVVVDLPGGPGKPAKTKASNPNENPKDVWMDKEKNEWWWVLVTNLALTLFLGYQISEPLVNTGGVGPSQWREPARGREIDLTEKIPLTSCDLWCFKAVPNAQPSGYVKIAIENGHL